MPAELVALQGRPPPADADRRDLVGAVFFLLRWSMTWSDTTCVFIFVTALGGNPHAVDATSPPWYRLIGWRGVGSQRPTRGASLVDQGPTLRLRKAPPRRHSRMNV